MRAARSWAAPWPPGWARWTRAPPPPRPRKPCAPACVRSTRSLASGGSSPTEPRAPARTRRRSCAREHPLDLPRRAQTALDGAVDPAHPATRKVGACKDQPFLGFLEVAQIARDLAGSEHAPRPERVLVGMPWMSTDLLDPSVGQKGVNGRFQR